jgi:hypothetical protein
MRPRRRHRPDPRSFSFVTVAFVGHGMLDTTRWCLKMICCTWIEVTNPATPGDPVEVQVTRDRASLACSQLRKVEHTLGEIRVSREY